MLSRFTDGHPQEKLIAQCGTAIQYRLEPLDYDESGKAKSLGLCILQILEPFVVLPDVPSQRD
ncbi:hypothetical protein K488DRAFT_82105 [Vararia minispora EC-137]|uniref:Uncharacterized protein n=1 Tax=Vararia minispora EC-137 TaxID=1314806 RepID=A0ACB8QXV9_9AGAM|nr:hypothetical protein K488DRAFT_82105 [Vararia minispora EC-137]